MNSDNSALNFFKEKILNDFIKDLTQELEFNDQMKVKKILKDLKNNS